MKKLINRPEAAVEEMVDGLTALYPGLRRLHGQNVVVRADVEALKASGLVALVSGGGSGHEPAHAGYVGPGMLSAAVAGQVFTSPSPRAILLAIQAVTGPAGALLIVKNYTGDRLNFGLAAEVARTDHQTVEIVVVADDAATRTATSTASARGLAGTVLVHKVAGAAAASGADLHRVAAEARAAAAAVSTMGVALSPCSVPGAPASFTLPEGEVELGLGIHGEPGVRRALLETADRTVDALLAAVLAPFGPKPPRRVALLINNLGGTTAMELAIVARRALTVLSERQVEVERVYAGTFLTSLEMAGVSISVMEVDDARLARLDAPTAAPAWPAAAGPAAHPRLPGTMPLVPELASTLRLPTGPPRSSTGLGLERALRAVTRVLIDSSARLTELDRAVGDGDLGTSLARGASRIRGNLRDYPLDNPAEALHALGMGVQEEVGGTSGPLYSIFLIKAADSLRRAGNARGADPMAWADALDAGIAGLSALGGAKSGDRTMIDALTPAAAALRAALKADRTPAEALRAAADAAQAGADATSQMLPARGRSSYLGARALGQPDPGAVAVSLWLRGLAAELATR